MTKPTIGNGLIILAVTVLVVIIGYAILTMPDDRNGMQKLGDAIHELPNGPDKAARQLEDRTPGQKIGDAVKDTGDDIKHNTAE